MVDAANFGERADFYPPCRLPVSHLGRDQRDLLLDGVEPLAHPVHVLDEEVVPRSSTEGKSDQ